MFSDTYSVDRIYRSMTGPASVRRFSFDRQGPPRLVWITGYRAEIVGAEGQPLSPEFMCHSNLDFTDGQEHAELVRGGSQTVRRLFTASQGQMDVRFPEGFGIPVLSNERFDLTTQVLNLNRQEQAFDVRHRTTLQFVLDEHAGRPMKPLYQFALQSMVLLEGPDGFPAVPEGTGHGTSCAVGEAAMGETAIGDAFGRKFAAHWVVDPGRHVYHTPVTSMVKIPAESTTVHFIAVHLHPFAESLELRDWTTGETVFKSRARNQEASIGLRHVDTFASAEGLVMYRDHGYELVATYDNTSGEPQDSMAVMYLYAADPVFRNPIGDGRES
ncbi:MAG: hypothetical protein ACR2P8_02160 [Myxococcota bacterium]